MKRNQKPQRKKNGRKDPRDRDYEQRDSFKNRPIQKKTKKYEDDYSS